MARDICLWNRSYWGLLNHEKDLLQSKVDLPKPDTCPPHLLWSSAFLTSGRWRHSRFHWNDAICSCVQMLSSGLLVLLLFPTRWSIFFDLPLKIKLKLRQKYSFFLKIKIWRTSGLFVRPLMPLFWTSVDICLYFKAKTKIFFVIGYCGSLRLLI